MGLNDLIKKCKKLTAKLLAAAYKSKVIYIKLDEVPLYHRVYFLSSMNSLKHLRSQISDTYMLLLYYPSIRGEELLNFSINSS